MKLPIAVVAATIVAFAPTAFAHGDAKHEKKAARPISTEQTPFGREGDPPPAKRAAPAAPSGPALKARKPQAGHSGH